MEGTTMSIGLESSMFRRYLLTSLIAVGVAVTAACSENATEPELDDPTTLLQVIPEGGVTGVDPNTTITIEFSHSMGFDMEMYVVLHEGDTGDPLVVGTWIWSEDGTITSIMKNMG